MRNRSTGALVAEYSYNGLGFRTSWKYDADASGTVDGSDPVYWFTHDDRWRIVATYRGSDADPREVFVWHAAGLDGGGGSSYIDGVVLRQDDSSTAWTAEPDVLGRRVYPLQNWRADVVAVHDGGMIAERVKYSAYGVPFCVSAADFDADGDVDSADGTAFYAAHGAEDPSADLNLDGVVDFNDILAWIGVHNAGETGGRSVLSRASIRNRIGYAGYQHDPSITGSGQASGQSKYHVRHRVYDAGIGRWTRRDPLGYVDGMSVYGYVASRPTNSTDPRGLMSTPCFGGVGGCATPLAMYPPDSPRWPGGPGPGIGPRPWEPEPPALTWEPPCLDDACLRSVLDDPTVAAAIQRVIAACGSPSIRRIIVSCSLAQNCQQKTTPSRYCNRADVTICLSSNCTLGDKEILRLQLVHELTHAAQFCERGCAFYDKCSTAVCSEIEAYCRQSRTKCTESVCGEACESAGAGQAGSGLPCSAMSPAVCRMMCSNLFAGCKGND